MRRGASLSYTHIAFNNANAQAKNLATITISRIIGGLTLPASCTLPEVPPMPGLYSPGAYTRTYNTRTHTSKEAKAVISLRYLVTI